MTSTSTASPTTTLRCSVHRTVPTALRCDRCGRPFCRDCLVSRFITSRSSVWLCRSCAGVGAYTGSRRPAGGAGGSWGGGLIRHPSGAAGRGAGYWWAALGLATVILYGAYHSGLLRGLF